MPNASLPDMIPALPELFLAGTAMTLLLLGVFQKSGEKADDVKSSRLVSLLGVITLVLTLLLVLTVARGGSAQAFAGMFVTDAFAVFFKVFVLIASAASLVIAQDYLERQHIVRFEYTVLVLLATLGIMIGLFTVTGFINRMGAILLEIGAWSVIATILMAWIFGWLAGAGLPPTATYIVLAVIVVDPLRKLGIDPWVAHFFIFLIAVWGELSPPTSLTAAVAARIADASFMRTMLEAVRLCIPITMMSFAIFVRSDMVVNPGWPQIADTLLVTISTCGIAAAMLGRFMREIGPDTVIRAALAIASLVVMFYPDGTVALVVGVIVLLATVWGVFRHRLIAPSKSVLRSQPMS
jgi:TRAP-type uncharacterized transport system fused permease subunit